MKEFSLKDVMECFHSRGQYLCKFIGTKEIVWIRKEFNSHKIGLEHQHGRRFIVLGHQYGLCDVMWIRSIVEYRKGFRGGIIEKWKTILLFLFTPDQFVLCFEQGLTISIESELVHTGPRCPEEYSSEFLWGVASRFLKSWAYFTRS